MNRTKILNPFICCLFGFSLFTQQTFARHAIPVVSSQQSQIEGQLSTQWLKDQVQSQKITRISEVLSLLPATYFENYTLLFRSLSIQGASLLQPRVIIFGQDGHFILTFNGSPNQKGGNALEIVEQKKDGALEFTEVLFPEGGQGAVEFSPPNPQKCLQCHSSAPRPQGVPKYLWPTYNTWHGAYGEKDDNVHLRLNQLTEFKTLGQTHTRYKYLDLKEGAHPYYDYKNDSTMEATDSGVRHMGTMPNHRLHLLMLRRQAISLYGELSKQSGYEQNVSVLFNTLICHGRGAIDFYKNKVGLPPDLFTLKFTDELNYLTDSSGNGEGNIFYNLGYELYQDMVLNGETTFEFQPAKNGAEIHGGLIKENLQEQSFWDQMISIGAPIRSTSQGLRGACDSSLGFQLVNFTPLDLIKTDPVTLVPDGTQPQELTSCVDCHSYRETDLLRRVGPYIPFHREAELRERLSQDPLLLFSIERAISTEFMTHAKDGGFLMPLGRKPLSPEDQSQLLHYLRSL